MLYSITRLLQPGRQIRKVFLCVLSVLACGTAVFSQQNRVVTAMGQVRLAFALQPGGVPVYSVFFGEKPVILPSALGYQLNGLPELDSNFRIVKIDSLTVDDHWQPVWGEVKTIRNHYRQLTIHLQQQSAPQRLLNIVFRVFADGVGFRYEFPLQPNLQYFVVAEEKTAFNLTGNHKTFWIPGDYDSNEYLYTTSRLSDIDGWKATMISPGKENQNRPDPYAVQTPLMLKTEAGLYINIHEAALVDYASLQLHVDRQQFRLVAQLVPDVRNNSVYLRTPAHSPWRTIIVSNQATDLLASKLILNLNEPSEIKDPSWIKPMKFMGVWWEMQVDKSAWSYTADVDRFSARGGWLPHGRHGANTANVKRYLDFASKNGIQGLLVEGWNTGWEEWGADKEQKFDFLTPYPDFDIAAIARYARQKGVQLIMHHETGGSATSYDQQMDTAFRLMNRYGYHSVKTGYVGGIIPRGEHHDGQWMVDHYLRSIRKAARYRIMLDIHEPVRPTGLHRTWPNFMASEAGRGNEWNAFSTGSPPEHETILPFTRLMGGPMDYTPGIFKMKGYAKGDPQRQMHSTLAKQLALYVTMYSPLQMAADLPENYEAHPDAFRFIREVPVDWDDTKVLEAEPGDYITIARKEKGEEAWYIGAITDENERTTSIPLSFLEKGMKYRATVYRDADNADWQNNPEAYRIDTLLVDQQSRLPLKLAKGGGAAVSIVPVVSKQVKKGSGSRE